MLKGQDLENYVSDKPSSVDLSRGMKAEACFAADNAMRGHGLRKMFRTAKIGSNASFDDDCGSSHAISCCDEGIAVVFACIFTFSERLESLPQIMHELQK